MEFLYLNTFNPLELILLPNVGSSKGRLAVLRPISFYLSVK